MKREDMKAIFEDNLDLLISKNQDYGSANLVTTGLRGVAVRLLDKASRLVNLTNNGATPNHESIEVNFQDAANYGAIGQALGRGLLDDKSRMYYLSGPIDLVGIEEATRWRELLGEALRLAGHAAFNPLTAFRGGSVRAAKQIDAVNRTAVEWCDGLVAMIVRGQLGIGTFREIEFARAMGKQVVLISDIDFTRSISAHDLDLVGTMAEALLYLGISDGAALLERAERRLADGTGASDPRTDHTGSDEVVARHAAD